jgi:MFS family permease
LLIRLRLEETPAFAKMKAGARAAKLPILEVLSRYPREVAIAVGARIAENGAFYIYSVFALVYGTQHVHLARQTILNGVLLGAGIEVFLVPMYGALSDRVGRRPVYLFGAVMTAVLAFPLFWLIDTGSPPLIWTALVLSFVFGHAPMYGPQASFFAELFGTDVRYTGASLGGQLSSVLAGGLSPFIATALLAAYGRTALALYLIAMAATTVFAVLAAAETHRHDIDQ